MKVRPGYKQTEVGVIPEDWETPDLASITDPNRPISYGVVQTGPNVAGGVRCLRVLDIEAGRINRADLITTSEQISASYKRTILVANDLVMPLRGRVGDVGIIDKDLVGCNLTRGVALIAVRPESSPRYCKQAISSSASRSRLEQSMNGSALQEIPIGILRRFKLALPATKAEQETIAEALTDADALIESLERLLTKKRQIKKGAMQELLTGKKRLLGFSGEWETGTFGEIFQYHPTATNSRNDLLSAGDTFYIHYGDIHTRFHNHLDFGVVKPPRIDRSRCSNAALLKNGDWVMADASEDHEGVGKSIEIQGLDTNMAAVAGLHTFLLRENIPTFSPSFKGHLGNLKSLHDQFLRVATGMKVYGVSKAALQEIELPIPHPKEQTAIATILSDMDAEITAFEAKLSKAHLVKQGMMQELLTGRIRLL